MATRKVYIIVKDGEEFVPNVRVEFNGVDYYTLEDGVAILDIWTGETHGRFSLIKEGYVTEIYDIELTTRPYYNCFSIHKTQTEPDIEPAPNLQIREENFYTSDGSPHRLQGLSAFNEFWKWLQGDKNDPFNEFARSIGCNLKRVFGAFYFGATNEYPECDFNPYDYSDYFEQLDEYLAYQKSQGFHVQFVPLCRAEIIDTLEKSQEFTSQCSNIVAKYDCHIYSISNEPYKNLPPGVDIQQLRDSVREGVYYGLGAGPGEDVYEPIGHIVEVHADRSEEWVRKARQAQEVREHYHCPVFSDEPIGAASTNQPGRRSNVPTDFYQFHALASQYYGSVIHFEAGLRSTVPKGRELECVEAGAAGWHDIPMKFLDGNFLYITDNIPGEKSYGVELGNEGCCVIVHPDGGEVIPKDGWKITENIDNTVYYFERT